MSADMSTAEIASLLAAGEGLNLTDINSNPETLDKAIKFFRLSSTFMATKFRLCHPIANGNQQQLFKLLCTKYNTTKDIDILKESIDLGFSLMLNTPIENPELGFIFDQLGFQITSRYERTRWPIDLDIAINFTRAGIALTPSSHCDMVKRLGHLGYCLKARATYSNSLKDADEAIRISKQVLQLMPDHDPYRLGESCNLASRYATRYELTSRVADRDEALRLSQELVTKTRPDDPIRGVTLNNLVIVAGKKFDQTGFQTHLEEAIRVAKIAVAHFSPTDEQRLEIVRTLRRWLYKKYEMTREVSVLREAVMIFEQMSSMVTLGVPESFEVISTQADLWKELFERTNEPDALERALDATEKTMNMIPSTEKEFNHRYGIQAATLAAKRFLQKGNGSDWITVLIATAAFLVDQTEQSLPGKLADEEFRLQTARKAFKQFDRLQDATDDDKDALLLCKVMHEMYGRLEKEITFLERMASILNEPVDVPMYYGVDTIEDMQKFCEKLDTFGLSTSFRIRIRFSLPKGPPVRFGKEEEEEGNLAERSTDPEDLQALSERLRKRGDSTLDPEVLQSVVESAETAFMAASSNDPGRLKILDTLTELCVQLNDIQQDIPSLDKGIRYFQLLIIEAGDGNKNQARYEEQVAMLYQRRSKQTGSEEDLRLAILHAEQALEMTPAGSPHRSQALFTLAMALKSRYLACGEPKDLEKCVRSAQEAMTMFPESEIKQHSVNFALIMRASFRHTGAISDIDTAIQYLEKAVHEAEDRNSFFRAGTRMNLGIALGDRYSVARNKEDLLRAINVQNEALEMSPQINSKLRSMILVNLAQSYCSDYERTRQVNTLNKAIRLGEEALELIPLDSPDRSIALNDLSEIFLEKFLTDKSDVYTLQKAVKMLEEAKKLTPPGNLLYINILYSYWIVLSHKLEAMPSAKESQLCLQAFKDAWESPSGSLALRIKSAWAAGRCLLGDGNFIDAARLLEDATKMLSLLSKRSLERDDKQHALSSFSGLVADAALAAIKAGGEPKHALELLELGRNIITSITINYRSPIPELDQEAYPEIIRKFNHLRMEADILGHESKETSSSDAKALIKHRREIDEEMERLLSEIRLIPGYEDFLLPQKAADIMSLASDGPIVIILTSKIVNRSDAIIIQESGISSIPLLDLYHREANLRIVEMIQHICRGPPTTFAARNSKMGELLLWLWDVAVEPILYELNLLGPDTEPSLPLPNVRWIGVGILANAPFHAAGDHLTPGSSRQTMSKCISSYLPTVRSLAFARSRPPRRYLSRKQDSRLLVVAMPTSPAGKGKPLPSVASEAAMVLSASSAADVSTKHLIQPSVSSVIQELPTHNIVHFACHGCPDPTNPSNSHLILQDGDLSVAQIVRSHAAEADLAYLSACSTAVCKDSRLADEGLHIVSSFQLAGFRHVVGTLWDTIDWACQDVASEFYRGIFALNSEDENEETWGGKWRFAEALHFSVEKLRRVDPGLPLLWAPFVHFGG